MWLILGITSCVILSVIYVLHYFCTSLKPPRTITPIHPSDYGLPCEKISFETADKVTIKAWFIPSPNSDKAGIIICHGYPMDKGNVLTLAKFLYPDYHLLLFDFRAMGESEGRWTTLGYHEQKDLEAALDYLCKRGIDSIGVLGLSLGAAVALMTSTDPRLKAIVADSPFASMDKLLDEMHENLYFLKNIFNTVLKKLALLFLKINLSEISPENTIRKVQKPILIIHGKEDRHIDVSHAQALKKAQPNIELWLVEGCDHIQAHDYYTEEYEKKVKEFLRKAFELRVGS